MDKIAVCLQTRAIAAEALYSVLLNTKNKWNELTEASIRDLWMAEMRKNSAITPDGWYIPPPHGIGVILANDQERNYSRFNYASLRNPESWPQDHSKFLFPGAIMYAYASPVDKQTGIFGDFGVTLYFGNDEQIHAYTRRIYTLNEEIINSITVGQEFNQISTFASKKYQEFGLTNAITSSTDPVGINLGHTNPFIQIDLSAPFFSGNNNDWRDYCQRISTKRIFINSQEKTIVEPGMVFSIEPRAIDRMHPELPMTSFHVLVAIKPDGSKEIITNFAKLFELAGMKGLYA